jgi:hypothetical protein
MPLDAPPRAHVTSSTYAWMASSIAVLSLRNLVGAAALASITLSSSPTGIGWMASSGPGETPAGAAGGAAEQAAAWAAALLGAALAAAAARCRSLAAPDLPDLPPEGMLSTPADTLAA